MGRGQKEEEEEGRGRDYNGVWGREEGGQGGERRIWIVNTETQHLTIFFVILEVGEGRELRGKKEEEEEQEEEEREEEQEGW